jgi:hypothetical protein
MAVTVYYSRLTIPAGTTTAAPASATVRVNPGRLIQLRLYVPPGPQGTVSLWFNHLSRQLAPVPPSTWDNLDDINPTYPLDYDLPPNETSLTLYGVSPNASFSHSIDFEVLVDSVRTVEPGRSTPNLVQAVRSIFS